MKMRLANFVFAVFLLGLLASPAIGSGAEADPSKDLRVKVQAACFEVVVKKPEKDSLTYEKELPWDLIDFNIRNDKYWPLGTAFAISDTELVTAAHVLDMMDETPFYQDFYIRDAGGNVYPIDKILSFHNAKDFVKFTVKAKPFETWFTPRADYAVNETVLAVGNIYGEGLVSIPGTLLGTLPEPENGQWRYLKSSPPNDSGSSGGPLLDQDGNVLGVIVAKNDNFSYSLPVGEIANTPKNTGIYHQLVSYAFNLFPEQIDPLPFDQEVSLPAPFNEVKREINRRFADHYRTHMDKLFADNHETIFPLGKASLVSLNSSCNAPEMQVLYKDKDDLTWYFSDLEKEFSALDKNGSILFTDIDSTLFIDLVKPDDIALEDLYDNPKLVMDLILKGINMPRKLADQDTRILSLGKPMSSDVTKDAYGRTWMVNVWGIEYSDQAGILFSSPTPDGMVCLLKFVSYSQRHLWSYDLTRTLDFVYIPYIGTLEQWSDYLAQKDLLYGMFKKAQLDYKPTAYFHLKTGEIDVDLDAQQLKIADKSRLSLLHDFYLRDGHIVWGIRKVVYSEEKNDNYFVVYRHVHPDPELPDRYKRQWETVTQKEHPYDEISFSDEGRTNVATLHPKYTAGAEDNLSQSPWIDTIYLGSTGNIPEERMSAGLNSLKEEIQIP